MYTRFKIRGRKKAGKALDLVLVESHRIEGKVRQKVIKHLGTIADRDLGNGDAELALLKQVSSRLDKLAISKSQKILIEEKIATSLLQRTQPNLEAAQTKAKPKPDDSKPYVSGVSLKIPAVEEVIEHLQKEAPKPAEKAEPDPEATVSQQPPIPLPRSRTKKTNEPGRFDSWIKNVKVGWILWSGRVKTGRSGIRHRHNIS